MPPTAPSSPSSPSENILACSFCGKPNTTVERIVAGPGVYICNECVELSAAILEEAARTAPEESSRQRSSSHDRSVDDILAALPALARSCDRVEARLTGSIRLLREQGTDWPTIAGAAGMSVDAVRRRVEAAPSV